MGQLPFSSLFHLRHLTTRSEKFETLVELISIFAKAFFFVQLKYVKEKYYPGPDVIAQKR